MKHSEQTKIKISVACLGKKNGMYGKRGILNKRFGIPGLKGKDNPFFGKKHSDETKKAIGLSSKMRKSILNTRKGVLPTKIEKMVKNFLDLNYSKKFKYTGNGKFWIEDMNPDFIRIDEKRECIEVFGCYWHSCPNCFPNTGHEKKKYTDKQRIEKFKIYGYRCLILWGHDIKKSEIYKNKIIHFIDRGQNENN